MKLTKKEFSWAMYDWANSAFTLIVLTSVMPIYFKSVAKTAGIGDTASTTIWGYTTSIGSLVIAILAPILGTLAAYIGMKKKLFSAFIWTGIGFTAMLALIPSNNWLLLLIIYLIAFLAYEGAIIFYDSFIVDVTEDERMDRVSTHGFSFGYIGSIIPFMICMALIMLVPKDYTVLATKASFVITAIWWGIFSIPILKNVNQLYGIEKESKTIYRSFSRMFKTMKSIYNHKNVLLFLIAYFFYIDGVNTVIAMASSFATDLGMDSTMLLILILIIQIVAIPFALLYGQMSKKFGTKSVIYFGIITYIVICIMGYFTHSNTQIWIVAFLIGTAQGGLQALSRSFFGKIIPKEKSNEYFGFYSIFGRFAAILGPALMAYVISLTHNTNAGVLSLAFLFIIGAIVFYFVKDQE